MFGGGPYTKQTASFSYRHKLRARTFGGSAQRVNTLCVTLIRGAVITSHACPPAGCGCWVFLLVEQSAPRRPPRRGADVRSLAPRPPVFTRNAPPVLVGAMMALPSQSYEPWLCPAPNVTAPSAPPRETERTRTRQRPAPYFDNNSFPGGNNTHTGPGGAGRPAGPGRRGGRPFPRRGPPPPVPFLSFLPVLSSAPPRPPRASPPPHCTLPLVSVVVGVGAQPPPLFPAVRRLSWRGSSATSFVASA